MNARKQDDIRICLCGLFGKRERIAGNIGCFLNFRTCIVVSQNYGVFLFGQLPELFDPAKLVG